MDPPVPVARSATCKKVNPLGGSNPAGGFKKASGQSILIKVQQEISLNESKANGSGSNESRTSCDSFSDFCHLGIKSNAAN